MITELKENQVFVFGSNEAGIHGAGAANTALDNFGAIRGRGFGKFGQSFAIPTKDHNIQTLPLSAIQDYVDMFLGYAKLHPELEFLLTRIGCGLAGYSDKEIAPLFKNDILPNIIYPKEWNFTSYSV